GRKPCPACRHQRKPGTAQTVARDGVARQPWGLSSRDQSTPARLASARARGHLGLSSWCGLELWRALALSWVSHRAEARVRNGRGWQGMLFFRRGPVRPVLRFAGPIGMVTPLRPGLALASVAGAIEKAFAASKLPSVAVLVNSPGGSPVQSHLIFGRIRQLAAEKRKRVYVFCEDVAASGGYFL